MNNELINAIEVLRTGYSRDVYIEFRTNYKLPFQFMDNHYKKSDEPRAVSFNYAIKLIDAYKPKNMSIEYNIRDFETGELIYDCAW